MWRYKNKLVEIKIIWQTFSHLPQQWNPLVCYRVRRHCHLPAKVAANLTSCLYSSAVHMAVFLFFPRLQKQLTFSGLSSLKCFAQSEQLLRRAQDVSFFNLGPFQTCTFFLKKKKKILSITRLRLTGHRSEDHMNRWDQNVPPCLSLFRLLQIQKKDPTHQVCATEVTCSNPGSTSSLCTLSKNMKS